MLIIIILIIIRSQMPKSSIALELHSQLLDGFLFAPLQVPPVQLFMLLISQVMHFVLQSILQIPPASNSYPA